MNQIMYTAKSIALKYGTTKRSVQERARRCGIFALMDDGVGYYSETQISQFMRKGLSYQERVIIPNPNCDYFLIFESKMNQI